VDATDFDTSTEEGHIIPLIDVTRETLDWFDRYLGEVHR